MHCLPLGIIQENVHLVHALNNFNVCIDTGMRIEQVGSAL